MECEQCQIAQASTIRETETATGLIYYWRKTEIKCSATACETYGAHIVPTTFVSPFVFNIFSPAHLPFTPPRTWPLPHPPIILLTNWNAILSILSRHITRQSNCPARLVSRVSRWTDVLSLARPFDFGISQRSRLQTSENASDESRRRRSIEHLFLISFHFNNGAWALSIFKRFPCCGRSRKKRWILTDKN